MMLKRKIIGTLNISGNWVTSYLVPLIGCRFTALVGVKLLEWHVTACSMHMHYGITIL